MREELLERIDALAAKLGVGAEALWEILVRQVYVSAAQEAFLLTVCIAVFVWAVHVFRRTQEIKTQREVWGGRIEPVRYWSYRGLGDDGTQAVIVVTCAATAVALLATLVAAPDVIGKLMNPEFYALERLADALSGLR